MSTVQIDNKEYEIESLNEEQRNLLGEIQLVNQELQRSQYAVAVYQDRSQVLVSNLKLSLQKDEVPVATSAG